MKICYVNPTNNIRRPIAELARLLADKGNKITIVYPSSPNCKTEGFHFMELLKHENITIIPIKSYYYAKLRYSFPKPLDLIRKIRKAIRDNDIIHIWEYYYPISVLPLLLRPFYKNKKFILTTDGFVGYSYRPKEPWWLTPAFRLYTQLFARFLFYMPHNITTYGKAMLPYAKQAHVPLKKLKIVPTGIHVEKFARYDKKQARKIKKEFHIKNEKIVLFVGMLTERKGVDIVIKVSQKLLDDGHNIKTLIVGEAHGPNLYKSTVAPEYRDKIIFTGGRKDIAELMHIAHVLLLPSVGEGLPGVVMEAMAAGLPCVATDGGCTGDLIEDGVSGVLAEVYNMDDYLEYISKLIKEKKLYNALSRNAKEKISEYRWQNVYKDYLYIYK